MIVVGIDEAGYGPLLGPLVVSACVVEVPDDRADESLWQILAASVTDKPRKKDPRLPIADSKKLHKGDDGLAVLERTALACLAATEFAPACMRELLDRLADGASSRSDGYPWYAETGTALPVACKTAELSLHVNALRRDLTSNGCALCGVRSEPLLEGEYNELVGKTRNKSIVLLGATLRLIQQVMIAHPGQTVRFHIDRQGGRTRYGRWLMTSFDGQFDSMKIDEESDDRSAYTLQRRDGAWHIEFAKRGEERQLPTALASVFSKYVRELYMHLFNRYWRTHIPDLKPTAGYYTDGKRFLADVEPHLASLGLDAARLVRQL